jgi:signal transduction histidine kinase
MLELETVRLVAALADSARRRPAARSLADHLKADELLILVEDPGVHAFLPAAGFPPTLPGGPAWRAFLELARAPGVHRGEVGYPTPDRLVPALARSGSGIMLILLGERCNEAGLASLDVVLPLVAAMLRAEQDAAAARGELRAAQDHAREAQTLARALDASRAEVERTVRAVEQQARDLDEARANAEKAGQAKDEFLAMLGHELRNPLSPILTALQLMRLKNQSSREQDVIERQVQSLMRLVDDLLDVSRITRGKVDLRKERVELAEVAARAIEMSSPVLEKKQQVLKVNIPPRGLAVDADPARLAQVLANLLTNAAKYSDAETTITFAADRRDSRICVRVRDQGIGIGPEMLTKVFDLFVQQRQSIDRSQGGLGLGLAIVRSLVALHGGTVRAFSEGEGRGSEFVVELPPASGAVEQHPRAAGVVPGLLRREGFPERVLVVDDNDDATMLISEALDSLGYVVRTAPDGPTALRVAGEFDPDVALLDIGLPVMDGYELAQRLRETSRTRRLHLIAITGYGQGEDRVRSKAVGFDAHLVKPVALDQLQQLLEQMRGA